MSTILLAGGGTGGHIYPLIAVADALSELCPALRIVFVGASKGYEKTIVPSRGYQLVMTPAGPMRGEGLVGGLRGTGLALRALGTSGSILRRFRPQAILTVGGYAAGPISLMARLVGIPVALLEPNAVMGLANRVIAPMATRGYTVFPEVERHFRRGRTLRLGLPLRKGFEARPSRVAGGPLRILVLGGSQGARALNEAMPEVTKRLSVPVQVRHQSGVGNEDSVRQAYRERGRPDAVVSAYIENMAEALGEAELVISRSGAGAVSETCAVGRPSLLVPYPFAAGDHQRKNAELIEAEGAGVHIVKEEPMVDQLVAHIERLARSPALLMEMAKRAERFGRPDAAYAVARDLLAMSGITLGAVASTEAQASDDRFSEVS